MRVRDLAVFLAKTTTVLLSVAVFFIVFRVRKDTPLIAVAEKEQALFWLMPCLTFFVLLWFCMAREKRVRWTVADLLACVLLAYVVFRSGSRTEYAWAVPVALGCLYLNLRIVFSLSRGVVPVLVLALLSTGIAEAVTGLMQLYGMASSNHSLFGMTGSFFNPGPYSNYLAVIVPVAFYYVLTLRAVPAVLSASKGRARFVRLSNPDTLIYYASWLFLLLALVVLPATRGRIAWLAVLGSGLVAVCRETPAPAYIRKFYRRRKFLFVTIGSAVLVLVVVSLVGLYRYKKDSAGGRWLIWNVSAQLIRENPAFGVGTGCFAGAYGNAQEASFVSGAMTEDQVRVAGAPDYAFNDFLQITVETGAAGALLFLSVVVLSFRGLARRRDGLLYGLTSLMIVSLASYPLNLLPFCILLVFFIAAAQDDGRSGRRFPAVVSVALLSGTFAWSCCAVSGAEKRYRALQDWKLLQGAYQLQDYRFVAGEYEELYPELCDEPRFLFEYGHALNKSERYFLSDLALRRGARFSGDPMFWNVMGNNSKARGDVVAAERYYQKAYRRLPNRLYPLYLLAKLYFETGQDDKAREMADRVLSFDPKVPSTAVREMKGEIRRLQNRELSETDSSVSSEMYGK